MNLGRYRLLERLGSGGMAEVFRATADGPKGFSRELAIKRIRPEYADFPEFIDMLVAEARLSAMLHHPAIAQVFDFGEIEGAYFLAMELIDGCDLSHLIMSCRQRGVKVPPGVVCHLVGEVASALAYAHARTDADGRALEIVHRDVSPSNIMISPAGAVKLLDFGIAKASSVVRDDKTRTGMLKGKISYMSPEQADGLKVDLRSDVFALGIVFHETLLAERLFKGDNDFETLRLVREAQVKPPSESLPGLDPAIDGIVLKMLAVAPEDRFQDCAEVVASLLPITRRLHGDNAATRRFVAEVGAFDKVPLKPDRVTPSGGDRYGSAPQPGLATLVEPEQSGQRSTRSSMNAPLGELVKEGSVREPSVGGSRTISSPSNTGLGPPIVNRSRWVWAALGLLIVTGLGFVVGRTASRPSGNDVPIVIPPSPPGGETPPQAAAQPPPAPEPAPEPAVVNQVRLRIRGTSGAEASLDGKLIGMLPLDVSLPRADGTRRLDVKLPGYKPYTRNIAADFDVVLQVDLTAQRPSRSSSKQPFIRNPFGP